jgi:hypothetical protein
VATARSAVVRSLILLFVVSLARLGAQSLERRTSFVIEPNRPYVYLKFDHLGPGIPRDEHEPKTRTWLWLVNNCNVGIVVAENGTPDGSPKEEREIMYDVVPTIMANIGLGSFNAKVGEMKPQQGKAGESTSNDSGEIPRGYMGEVGSTERVSPGERILFSVPVNHLSERWHIEIPYTFDLPEGKCCRDADIGGEPKMVIEYSLWDLPPNFRAKIQQK